MKDKFETVNLKEMHLLFFIVYLLMYLYIINSARFPKTKTKDLVLSNIEIKTFFSYIKYQDFRLIIQANVHCLLKLVSHWDASNLRLFRD